MGTAQMGEAVAYPIFAQQNYKEPREYSGKIVCANCHLASKPVETIMPNIVLPDTIFKMEVEVPLKYEKRVQPIADGSKAPLNVGAIAVMPEGFKLAPKDRLPKSLKKQMKGCAWSGLPKADSASFGTRPWQDHQHQHQERRTCGLWQVLHLRWGQPWTRPGLP